ncbi:MAG: DUF5723 family protein, partial [Bacteroidales bacterium]
ILLSLCFPVMGQQSHTLYFLHNVPQSNLLNPAVQNECKLFIGLPLISSLHINLANSGFTYNQLLEHKAPGEYSLDASTLYDKLGKKNYLSAELDACLFSFGIKIKTKYYFTFNIRERNDMNLYYTKDLFSLVYKGNTQYEGKLLSLKGNGMQFNHFREFSLGASKVVDDISTYGIRVKLLYGKLNFKTARDNVSLFTEENTFDLFFENDIRFDASLPASLINEKGNIIRADPDYYYTSVNDLIFNRKNYGFAFDAGFIHKYDEKITIHGSILDLGFIVYRSNLTNYSIEGSYLYTGPLGDDNISESYIQNLIDDVNEATEVNISRNPYFYFMSPRMYFGVSNQFMKKLSVNALVSSRIMKQKLQSGLTLSANWRPHTQFATAVSWSYFHRSINNFGAGMVLGRNPVQFYIVSDNVVGLIWPQSTKNINLRFGLNIITGCRSKSVLDQFGCYWLKKAEERNERKKRLMHK